MQRIFINLSHFHEKSALKLNSISTQVVNWASHKMSQKCRRVSGKASCMDSLECETVDNPNVSAANRTNRTNNTQQLEQIVQIVNVLCHN